MKHAIHIVLAALVLTTGALQPLLPVLGHAHAVTTCWMTALAVEERGHPESNAEAAGETQATDETDDDSDKTPGDTTPFPKKQSGRTVWEKVLSAPGWLIASPFIIFSYLAGAAIIVDEKYDVAKRTRAFLTSDDGRRGLNPVYTPIGGFGASLYARDYFNDDFRSSLTASWSSKGRAFYQARWRRLNLWDGFVTTGFRVQYRNLPDEKFYGIGPDSQLEDETNFQQLQPLTDLMIGRRFTDRFQADVILGFERDDINEGKSGGSPSTTDVFDEQTLPGVDVPASMLRVGLDAYWDRRNRKFRPSSGFWLLAGGGAVYEPSHTDFGFTTLIVDFRWFHDLFYERILVLRLAGRFTDPLPAREIPFYKLAELGTTETIRGYTRGRFRDRDAIWTTVEYRYPIWRVLDGVFFTDFGYVSQDVFSKVFRIDDVIWSAGGGVRLWDMEGVRLRAELGYGEDGFRFHFIIQ
ncbi:MAG: BamA/TamA family outer membrane protein [bacterium]|nr:BamA/TamA family outer membrane protein [bacterium]